MGSLALGSLAVPKLGDFRLEMECDERLTGRGLMDGEDRFSGVVDSFGWLVDTISDGFDLATTEAAASAADELLLFTESQVVREACLPGVDGLFTQSAEEGTGFCFDRTDDTLLAEPSLLRGCEFLRIGCGLAFLARAKDAACGTISLAEAVWLDCFLTAAFAAREESMFIVQES
ncbi:hypothetical protein OGATHE_000884 [Ogataea polymorpha]|uniref:Uncharacterized protein n=1 Tax=Ogataea polymorpha TaxID=460523 RepID=A0A9P8PTK9_9ASCO|nr:hypothetical protein OGATHE_000884 [Ogataea polymorpha]